MVEMVKFSEFASGGTLVEGDVAVGIKDGANARFTSSTQFQLPGTTAERPDPATNGMIRYNTDLSLYEFYNGAIWTQFEDSADIALLIARLAAYTAGDGASMIGLEDQGAVSSKTVQDLAEADFIVKSVTSSLANAIALSGLSTGILVNETATGNLVAREIEGTADQVDVADGTGLSGNPTLSIASNPTLPGSSHVVIPFGTTAQRPGVPSNGYLRYNTDLDELEYYDTNASTWVQPATSGVQSVTGTANQVIVSGTATDPILGAPQDIATTSSPTFAGMELTGVLDMSAQLINDVLDPVSPQDAATKAYVDNIESGLVDSVTGTTNEIDISGTAADPIIGLSATPEIGAATGTSLNLGSSTTIDGFLDEDNMASNSATKGATQQSIKAYVDTVAGGLVDSVTGTTNEIDISGTAADPIIGLSATPEIGAATGTSLNLGSSTTIDGFLDEDNMASNSATKGATQQSIKAYVDTVAGGLVDSVTGTVNEIDVDNTDPANPVLSLSATLDVPGTLQIQASAVALDDIIDDDTMATATDTNISTSESIKAYVDAQVVAAGSGGLKSVQVFDASGTWTKPAGIDQILVQVVGGGGAGGSSLGGASVASAAGGGGGGFSQKLIDVTGIPSETVTIGSGGTPGAAGNNAGGNGGDTTFGAHCTGGGGGGGNGSANAAYSGGSAGVGGVGSGGDINSNGGPGGNGATRNGNGNPGFGGSTFFGGGASAILSDAVGNSATSAGGGGGGSVSTSTSRQGGAGEDGIVIVYEYTVGATIPFGNVAPVGAIMSFARTTSPVGFLECDGSAVSRTTYSELFTAIGTTWGVGDGSTTFNIPNLPRRTLVGSGGTGTAELGNAVGDTGGEEDHTIATTELPANTINYAGSTLTNHIGSNTGSAGYYPALSAAVWNSNGGGASNIIQPSAVVLMCIAYQANVVADATAASQAEMETATSNTVFSTPGRQQLHPGHPKAWVVYDQGTPSVLASYNVTSVTDSAAGRYIVNWTTAFSSANYAVNATTVQEGTPNFAYSSGVLITGGVPGTPSISAGSVTIVVQQGGTDFDVSYNCVAAYGDQ